MLALCGAMLTRLAHFGPGATSRPEERLLRVGLQLLERPPAEARRQRRALNALEAQLMMRGWQDWLPQRLR